MTIKIRKKKNLYLVRCLYCGKAILAFSADERDLIDSAQLLKKHMEMGELEAVQPQDVAASPDFWCCCPR